MANHKSAIKRIRQNEKRRLHNRTYRNRARTLVKKARVAIDSGNLEEAREATHIAVRDLDKLASRGVVHKRNAARRKSRLMQQLAQLEKYRFARTSIFAQSSALFAGSFFGLDLQPITLPTHRFQVHRLLRIYLEDLARMPNVNV